MARQRAGLSVVLLNRTNRPAGEAWDRRWAHPSLAPMVSVPMAVLSARWLTHKHTGSRLQQWATLGVPPRLAQGCTDRGRRLRASAGLGSVKLIVIRSEPESTRKTEAAVIITDGLKGRAQRVGTYTLR